MSEITIQPATKNDCNDIMDIWFSCAEGLSPEHYTQEQIDDYVKTIRNCRNKGGYFERMLDKNTRISVAKDKKGAVLGFGIITPATDKDIAGVHMDDTRKTGKITFLYVKPGLAGNGIGSQLLNEMEDFAKENGYTNILLKSALESVAFYKAKGYQHTSAASYSDPNVRTPISLALMTKSLLRKAIEPSQLYEGR